MIYEYPLDHPLQRIFLAYFENNEDEQGVRYALEFLNAQLSHYDLDEQEFEDAVDFILNELLYNEEETLVASVLYSLRILIIKENFPDAYRACALERLSMIETFFREEGVVLAPLVDCLLGISIRWEKTPQLQARARELLELIGRDHENVTRLKALARGLGLSVTITDISEKHADECLALLQDLLRRNEDWRIQVYVTQSLSMALKEGFIASPQRISQLMALVEGFLGEEYTQSLCRPVAEFFSRVLGLGDLDDDQIDHCWGILLDLLGRVREGGTQCAVLHQLGMAMHWKAMTPEQEDQCYAALRKVLDAAEEERTLHDMMVVLAQAIAGMYAWGHVASLERWGGFFRELILEVEPLCAYSCLNRFLQGPMAKICFTEEHLSQLANDVLNHAENNEAGQALCIQVLDAMVSSSLLGQEYFVRFWNLLRDAWGHGQPVVRPAFWEYLSHSASGLVTNARASESVRREVFEGIMDLFESTDNDEVKLLSLAQAFSVFLALSDRLPQGAFECSLKALLSLANHPSEAIRIVVFDGLESALLFPGITREKLVHVAETLLAEAVDDLSEDALVPYARTLRALQGQEKAPEPLRTEAMQRLRSIMDAADGPMMRKLAD